MSEGQFTPGPWQSQHQFDVAGECAIIGAIDGPDDGRFHYTTVCEVNEECSDFRANARLIAAAPELYDALSDAVEEIKALWDWAHQQKLELPHRPIVGTTVLRNARAALEKACIAKAGGQ